eukprot:1176296-Prorocentrum_minimum.AAC.8
MLRCPIMHPFLCVDPNDAAAAWLMVSGAAVGARGGGGGECVPLQLRHRRPRPQGGLAIRR